MFRVLVIRCLLRATSLLPLPLAHALGTGLGALAGMLPGKTRNTVRTNLALCFPELDTADRRALERQSFRELGRQLLELGIVWHASPQRLKALVRNPEAMDELEALWNRETGLLLAAPHLGNWELASLYLNQRFPINNLYRPPRDAAMEPLLVAFRERTGAHSYPATPSGIRSLYKALRGGEVVGILPDQTPGGSGVFAPFFGQPALTMTLLCQMARKSGAPVVFVFCERLAAGRGFKLHIRRGNPDIAHPDTDVAAAAMNRDIEDCVRLVPGQYQWTYRRFRRRPEGQPNPYRAKTAG